MKNRHYFLRLKVWQEARILNRSIYQITKDFPESERFGLTSQIRRCGVSVCSNIAEGSSRSSGKDQARFTELAYGSLLELLNQLILSNDLEFIKDQSAFEEIDDRICSISKMLTGLRKTQLSRRKI
ncbi:MAG: four helix bundle protein [Bacteroidetes bacterium]|nr:four helix bundle protein [Bacteroidota bacterium]